LNQAYFNNLFTGNYLKLKQVTDDKDSLGGEPNHVFIRKEGIYASKNSSFIKAKVTSVPDSGLIRDGNDIFRNIAGSPNENTF
jgi:hypothetical protein